MRKNAFVFTVMIIIRGHEVNKNYGIDFSLSFILLP